MPGREKVLQIQMADLVRAMRYHAWLESGLTDPIEQSLYYVQQALKLYVQGNGLAEVLPKQTDLLGRAAFLLMTRDQNAS